MGERVDRPIALIARQAHNFFKLQEDSFLDNFSPVKPLPLAISLFALTIGISQADLFDDDEALVKRYGKPTQVSGPARIYEHGKFTVAVLMGEEGVLQGRSFQERFRLKSDKQMSFAEIEEVLKPIAFGGQRVRAGDNKWKMQNGRGKAFYDEKYRWVKIEALAKN
jgi:hypothetical protein